MASVPAASERAAAAAAAGAARSAERVHALLGRLARKALRSALGGAAPADDDARRAAERAARALADFPPAPPRGSGGAEAEGAALDAIRGLLIAEGRGGDTLLVAELVRKLPRQGAGALANRAALLRALAAIAAEAPAPPTDAGAHAAPQLAAAGASNARAAGDAVEASASTPSPARGAASPAARATVVNTLYETPEEDLVRDVVFALQGVDGSVVRWRHDRGAYAVDPKVGVTAPQRALVAKLCEAGARHRAVAAASAQGGAMARGGACAAALAAAMRAELAEFARLVAHLERMANQPVPSDGAGVAGGEGRALTLRRMAVWLAEPAAALETLARVAGACRAQSGGALLRVLHAEAQTGHPEARELTTRMLRAAAAPLWAMLARWLFEGILDDPHEEFFVAADPAVPDEYLWEMRYSLREAQLPPPALVPRDAAAAALVAGKAINFLRRCCGEAAPWEGARATSEAAAEAERALRDGDATALEGTVRAVGDAVNARLMEVLFSERFNLSEHLLALKRYLLLGQGDFVQALMDFVGTDLDVPAGDISPFKLAGQLESAVRASNTQFDHPDVLARLKVRVLPPADGESGWDVFALEYAVRRPGAPLDPLPTILDQQAMDKYARAFSLLWRLKRAEHAVNAAWAFAKPSSALERAGRAAGRGSALAQALHRMAGLRAALSHALAAVQHYMMGEALEAPWARFREAAAAARDLDALRAAHHACLDEVLDRALLGRGAEVYRKQLDALVDGAMRFRGLAERLSTAAADSAGRADELQRENRARAGRGAWAAEGTEGAAAIPHGLVDTVAHELADCEAKAGNTLRNLLAMLGQHKDSGLQGLVLQLDFGGYYRGAPQAGVA